MIIYLLRNKVNGKGYVGQTVQTLHARWLSHLCEMRAGSSCAIHRAIRKYGQDNFEKCILATASTLDELNLLEDFHICLQHTLLPDGYNLDTGGKNHRMHADTKAKLSVAAKNRPKRTGMPHSEQTKDRIRVAALNRPPVSQATKDKLSAMRRGRIYTEEQCANISATKKGKKRAPFSAEWRAKMSATHTGVKRAPFTAEALKNMSIGMKLSYARRNAQICPPTIH